jgi:hypothetical protein
VFVRIPWVMNPHVIHAADSVLCRALHLLIEAFGGQEVRLEDGALQAVTGGHPFMLLLVLHLSESLVRCVRLSGFNCLWF